MGVSSPALIDSRMPGTDKRWSVSWIAESSRVGRLPTKSSRPNPDGKWKVMVSLSVTLCRLRTYKPLQKCPPYEFLPFKDSDAFLVAIRWISSLKLLTPAAKDPHHRNYRIVLRWEAESIPVFQILIAVEQQEAHLLMSSPDINLFLDIVSVAYKLRYLKKLDFGQRKSSGTRKDRKWGW